MTSEDKFPRRQVLASLGVGLAGIAGCSARGQTDGSGNNSSTSMNGSSPSSNSSTSTANATSTNATTQTTKTASKQNSGPNVVPQDAAKVPPLKARPYPKADNPVLIPEDVMAKNVDEKVLFIADTMLFHDTDDSWHMFVEVLREDLSPKRGVIGHATSKDGGASWQYQGTVLKEDFHLSFPIVWKWQGDYYMSPQANGANQPLVYKATNFPNEWNEVLDVYGNPGAVKPVNDHAFFRWNDMWWLIGGTHDKNTYLYYNDSDSLKGSWKPHKMNPVVSNNKTASRPGGRPTVFKDHIYTYYQDDHRQYGGDIRGYKITELTTSTFKHHEVPESPLVDGTVKDPSKATDKWNSRAMHTYDPWYVDDKTGWLVSVDGQSKQNVSWKAGIYQVPTS